MNKKIHIALSILAIMLIFFGAYKLGKKTEVQTSESQKLARLVALRKVADSSSLTQENTYPASIVGIDEVTVVAKSSGNISAANFEVGSYIGAGTLLARIDDTGNVLDSGEKGLKPAQVQQAQLSMEQAKEALEFAKKNYESLKKQFEEEKSDPTLSKTINEAQVAVAKEQVDIAEIQYESAKVNAKSEQDNHLITSPTGGYVISKDISVGDSVTVGQPLATISRSKNIKARFFVDQMQYDSVKKGENVIIKDSSGKEYAAVIKNIASQADPETKKFLVEAYPVRYDSLTLLAGTVANVVFSFELKPSTGYIILPLSAVTIGQNENYIFISDGGRARKISVSVGSVMGEFAEVKADLPQQAEIIVEGGKLLRDGDEIMTN